MPIPGAMPSLTRSEHRRHLEELIRRAIGFQITFDGEQQPGSR
jgi:hypothetical protein